MGSTTPATTTQNQTGTGTSDPWSAATPLLQNLINQYGSMSTAPTSNQTNATTNLVNAANSIPNYTAPASAAVNNIFGNAGMLSNANQTLNNNLGATASGANLDPSKTPGFSDALNTLTQNITTANKGVYAGSGREPSGAGDFSKTNALGIAQGEAPLIQSQYNQNYQNMANANNTLFGAAGSTVSSQDANTMAGLTGAAAMPGVATAPANAQVSAANTQQALPYQDMLQQLQAAGLLGGMGSTTSSTTDATGTQTPANNSLMNWLGGGMVGASLLGAGGTSSLASGLSGLMFSDERLKENIEKVGSLADGQNVYSYNFKGHDTPQIGMLAQEVEKRHPEAVTEIGGIKAVDYGKATRRAAGMGLLPTRKMA